MRVIQIIKSVKDYKNIKVFFYIVVLLRDNNLRSIYLLIYTVIFNTSY